MTEMEKITQSLILIIFILVIIYIISLITSHGFESAMKTTFYTVTIIGFLKYILSDSPWSNDALLMLGIIKDPKSCSTVANQPETKKPEVPSYTMDPYSFGTPQSSCYNKFDSDLRSLAYMQNMNERSKDNLMNQYSAGRSLGPFYDDLMSGNDNRDWWENY